MEYKYQPKGVCSREIIIELKGDIIENVEFLGGCPGNALGINNLLKGETIDYAIKKLKGVRCGEKNTSCPDQLTKALEKIKKEKEQKTEN